VSRHTPRQITLQLYGGTAETEYITILARLAANLRKEGEMKTCSKECKHAQQYNDGWVVCWNKLIKGSKVQIGKCCIVDLIKTSPNEPPKLKVKSFEGDYK